MSLHLVGFEYDIPEYASIEIELDPNLNRADKEAIVLQDIKDTYPDVTNIVITKVEQI